MCVLIILSTPYSFSFTNGDLYNGPYVAEEYLLEDGSIDVTGRSAQHWGVWLNTKGESFEGTTVDNHFNAEVLNGSLKRTSPNGDVYEGDFVQSKFHGFGALTRQLEVQENIRPPTRAERLKTPKTANERLKTKSEPVKDPNRWGPENLSYYSGQWQFGLRHGVGLGRRPEGSEYKGQWEEDYPHGHGCFIDITGERYEGGVHNGEPHGLGKKEFSDGRVYEGGFVLGMMHGMGKLTYPDGALSEGPFYENKRHGSFNIVHADGERFEGNCENDLMDGVFRVVRWTSLGEEYQDGRWDTGEFIEWETVPINEACTNEFIERYEIDDDEYESIFTLNVARRLPYLPHGVDPKDVRVNPIKRRILRESGALAGEAVEKSTLEEMEVLRPQLEQLEKDLIAAEEAVVAISEDVLFQNEVIDEKDKVVKNIEDARDNLTKQFDDFWINDETQSKDKFYSKIEELIAIKSQKEWMKIRSIIVPPAPIATVFKVLCLLLDHGGSTEWNAGKCMIRNSEQNADRGEEEAILNQYELKVVFRAQTYDPFVIAEAGLALENIGRYMYDSNLKPENTHVVGAGMVAVRLTELCHACYKFVRAAKKISPVRKTLIATKAGLLVAEAALDAERDVLETLFELQDEKKETRNRTMRKRDQISRQVKRRNNLIVELNEMKVDYDSDNEEELDYYQIMDAKKDPLVHQVLVKLQMMIDDIELLTPQRRLPAKGVIVDGWIDELIPKYRFLCCDGDGGYYVEKEAVDDLFDRFIVELNVRICSILDGEGWTYDDSCMLVAIKEKWVKIDIMEKEAAASRAFEAIFPEGTAFQALRVEEFLNDDAKYQALCWTKLHPEEIAQAKHEIEMARVAAFNDWEHRAKVLLGNFEANILDIAEYTFSTINDPQMEHSEDDLYNADVWSKEYDDAYQAVVQEVEEARKAATRAFCEEMGYHYDEENDAYYEFDQETGEWVVPKTDEEKAAEAAAWQLFKDPETGEKYWFNSITEEKKYT
jgi:hypothetical protein